MRAMTIGFLVMTLFSAFIYSVWLFSDKYENHAITGCIDVISKDGCSAKVAYDFVGKRRKQTEVEQNIRLVFAEIYFNDFNSLKLEIERDLAYRFIHERKHVYSITITEILYSIDKTLRKRYNNANPER